MIQMLGLFLLGALGSAAVLLLVFRLIMPLFSGEAGWSLFALALYGYPVAIVLCVVVGIVFALRFRTSHLKKRLSLSGYVLLLTASGIVTWWYREDQKQLSAITKNRQANKDRQLQDWREKYEKHYPQNADSLPAVLGPFFYPDGKLINWKTLTNPNNEPKWLIEFSTEDDIEEVLAYYMSVLPEGLDQSFRFALLPSKQSDPRFPSMYRSKRQFTPDDRIIVIEIRTSPSSFFIACDTYMRPPYQQGHPELIEAWSGTLQDYQNVVAKLQKFAREELQQKLKDLVYPSATLVWSDLSRADAVQDCLFTTQDTIEDVSNFYSAKLGKPTETADELQWHTRVTRRIYNVYITLFRFADSTYVQYSATP